MATYKADFHVHIGRALDKPVKIAASKLMTVERVCREAAQVKGLDVITIVDGVCDHVLTEIETMLTTGDFRPLKNGGLLYRDQLLVLLGAEVEVAGSKRGAAHFGCWFATVEEARDFNTWLKTVQKNTSLSSQKAHTDIANLIHETKDRGGLFVIHHSFTPFKGLLGNCVDKISDFFDPTAVDALELGLSADTDMADRLTTLSTITFLSNSDAHGNGTIAREYNLLEMEDLSFAAIAKVLRREQGHRVLANYGLHPEHGKYFRSRCRRCLAVVVNGQCDCLTVDVRQHVLGVWDRLIQIADLEKPVHPSHRPRYIHRVPLSDIPGVGKRAYETLIDAYGNELAVGEQATQADLRVQLGPVLGEQVYRVLSGRFEWSVGGAGTYGKVILS